MKCLEPLNHAAQPAIFYVTDRQMLPSGSSENIFEKIRNATMANADFIQIREKRLSTGELLNLTREAVRIAKQEGGSPRVIVNDRLDVALAAGASGVHLGRESLAADTVIGWCLAGNAPPNFLVGVSCHSLQEARVAEKAGASYAFFGPIFDTPSKRRFGPSQGLALLADICRAVKIQVIAIGGVNESNAADCLKAGASGIAAIRLFQEAQDAQALRTALRGIHQIPLVSIRR